jgi:hypothetical protein
MGEENKINVREAKAMAGPGIEDNQRRIYPRREVASCCE